MLSPLLWTTPNLGCTQISEVCASLLGKRFLNLDTRDLWTFRIPGDGSIPKPRDFSLRRKGNSATAKLLGMHEDLDFRGHCLRLES